MSVGGDRRRAPGALWGKTRFYRAAKNLLTSKGMKRRVFAGSAGQVFNAHGLLQGEVQRQDGQSVLDQVRWSSTRMNDKKPSNPRQSSAYSYYFYSKLKLNEASFRHGQHGVGISSLEQTPYFHTVITLNCQILDN